MKNIYLGNFSAKAFVTAMVLVLAAQVSAKETGQVSARENGLKVGNGRLHPSFALESRYDSAAAWKNDKTADDMIFKLAPGIKLDLPSPAIALNFGANFALLILINSFFLVIIRFYHLYDD